MLLGVLNQWVKDNPGLAGQPTVNVTGGGSSGPSGGTGDLVAIMLALLGLGVALDPEGFGILGALESVQGAGGSEGLSLASGWFVGETLLQAAEPYRRILEHAIEASVVSQIFDPETAADMQAKGIITHGEAVSEAAGGGVDGQHLSWLVEHATHYPGLPEAFRLFNLGEIDANELTLIMDRNSVPASLQTQMLTLARQYLSIADLALGTLRGDITYDDGLAYAQMLGWVKEDFDRFVYNTGEPPGIMQMLFLYRRGKIDKPTLVKAILQSRVRDEWVQSIIDLQFEPMSVADAVTAVVQNHLTYDEGLKAATVAGLEPTDFDTLVQSAGEPLSRTEMDELYNRGLVTKAQVDQAARESRLKDKYVDLAFSLHRRLIPYRTINTIVSHGVRDAKWGIAALMDQGYTEDDASALIGTSTSAKTSHIKAASEAQVLEMYQGNAIDQAEAKRLLGDIGYSGTEADFLLSYTTAKRAVSEQNKAITFLRAGFLAHRVTASEASASMDALGVPHAQRDQLLTDWKIEQTNQVKVLTVAEITAAVKYNVVEFSDAQAALVEMGYSDNDAKVIICATIQEVPPGVTIAPISFGPGMPGGPTPGEPFLPPQV